MVIINGVEEETSGVSVLDYLNSKGYNVQRVVVEINFEIIPKDRLGEVMINDNDKIEILNFVGGG